MQSLTVSCITDIFDQNFATSWVQFVAFSVGDLGLALYSQKFNLLQRSIVHGYCESRRTLSSCFQHCSNINSNHSMIEPTWNRHSCGIKPGVMNDSRHHLNFTEIRAWKSLSQDRKGQTQPHIVPSLWHLDDCPAKMLLLHLVIYNSWSSCHKIFRIFAEICR